MRICGIVPANDFGELAQSTLFGLTMFMKLDRPISMLILTRIPLPTARPVGRLALVPRGVVLIIINESMHTEELTFPRPSDRSV